ncbi:MAG: Pilus retraction protein PilT [Candidatus Falkowbacteria bacterium GW2011_GWC2_38_22]|uniref:Pilus retraction protein PilT n=1 Tax=Candidatus Falkowbacteria bacterium GW2011_GWE1_38_31 TaxID=1618638 RepID=A0A0G0M954_9BACT|nr:MAG: Pilus retraction protein PilT [Candidatus Falkowbacteria bacterium GW2011_GWF2_38_1205]KKQ61046.1 MAG: Pilus retraction protein PilT [Candidatus Falkowbacteria bacterium GW2011_GWC2_38_22]KKQ63425.1 MAG: Pilus retraction protein PilT [Candidatus Falkowbacteria bacterium GW2011_GWF1_38_22]KKQ65504.1 MAG: Pilus retraction protein PilT [Candidatus Falkowbacteria bacterium GW2011_GWE2_38_254]KKQ70189.1 MAG: Pilus retraction protein PilT [Candidatus Falkowbacteria bacterium GW2011_GWE1_38_31
MNVKELFVLAANRGASDLHLVAGLPPVLRIDGELEYIDGEKVLTSKELNAMADSLLDPSKKERFAASRELDVGFAIDNYRYRVNLHYERGNIGIVARVINEKIQSLEELGMPKVVYNLLGLKQGLILLTGPTGCGKSTTLAAMVEYINNNRFCNIITLEDPIEYLFKSKKSIVIQRQLGSDMLSFSEGLKHALRQDPNVIMVGEMRDLETIATTITLAETGHLVLATLHTYNAAQTIDRIIDTFPPHQQNQIRMQVSMVLASVISQRLLPKIEGGRVAARELLINSPAVANLIRENKIAQIKTVIETCSKEGMMSIDQDLQRLYKEKLITKEVAQSQMDNPELLEKFK